MCLQLVAICQLIVGIVVCHLINVLKILQVMIVFGTIMGAKLEHVPTIH